LVVATKEGHSMRQAWEGVRTALTVRIQSSSALIRFDEIAGQNHALRAFGAPVALASWLQTAREDERANTLLRLMVAIWRGGAPYAEVANQVLWIGLWPLLNAIYRRQLWYWGGREQELISEIGIRLATVLRGTNLTRVTSVALTIARNTERDVIEARQARLRDPWNSLVVSWLGDLPADRGRTRIEHVADHLARVLGADFELVVAAYETGCDYGVLIRRFGLTEAEIRRRLRRAWRRVRERQIRKKAIEFP
jgi:hypothetical protein